MLDTGAVISQLWRPELDARIEASVVLLAELHGAAAPATNGAASSDEDSSSEEEEEAAGAVAGPSKVNGAAQIDVDGEDDAPAAASGDLESTVLRRLIRGLASPRDQARLGFAVALTEVRR